MYTKEIIRELKNMGHVVTYKDIQPRDFITKATKYISRKLYRHKLDEAHEAIVKSAAGKSYDIVLFIQVHQMKISTFQQLKLMLPSAKFILYNWDSLNNHNYSAYVKLFDKVYTFDPVDAETLGVNYLPLFCIKSFQNLSARENTVKTIYFVGNIVSVARYTSIQKFIKFCKDKNIVFKYYLACTPPVFLLLLRSGYLPLNVSFGSISEDKFIKMIETSTAVFDFANHKQSGCTMRVIENLCAGKKIITSNGYIVNENFYSDDRILVFDESDFGNVKEFIEMPIMDKDNKFEEFHLSNFLTRLLA